MLNFLEKSSISKMENSSFSDPSSGTSPTLLATPHTPLPTPTSTLPTDTSPPNPTQAVQANCFQSKGEQKISRASTIDSKHGEKNGVEAGGGPKRGISKAGLEEQGLGANLHEKQDGGGNQASDTLRTVNDIYPGVENGSETLMSSRGAGMKRSSSENATNFTRDLEISVDQDQHVIKPWKQRFSFRQPRRQHTTDTVQVLTFLLIYSSS